MLARNGRAIAYMAYRLRRYLALIDCLRQKGYALGPLRGYFEGVEAPFVFLRHDVDRLPGRAVAMAREEAARGLRASYYFRCRRRGGFPDAAVRAVSALGHEVGFHYECLARERGDAEAAFGRFRRELAQLRELAEVRTAAAHGSPLSRFDDRELLSDERLAACDLAGDAYRSIDHAAVLHLTDSGGHFGAELNLRDRVEGRQLPGRFGPEGLARALDPAVEPLAVLSCHPERWPQGPAGLCQAQLADGGAGLAKRLLRAVRAPARHTA